MMLIYLLRQYVKIFSPAGAFNGDLRCPMSDYVGVCYIFSCRETAGGVSGEDKGKEETEHGWRRNTDCDDLRWQTEDWLHSIFKGLIVPWAREDHRVTELLSDREAEEGGGGGTAQSLGFLFSSI